MKQLEVNNSTVKLVRKIEADSENMKEDFIATEAPLEIRISSPTNESTLSITMRTPGNDKELALGFLFSEGLLDDLSNVYSVEIEENRIIIDLHSYDVKSETKTERSFLSNSSCGVCGKTSLEGLNYKSSYNIEFDQELKRDLFFSLQEKLLHKQSLFQQTGGIHAAALFDLQADLIAMREDVGRHNALDKLIGYSFQKNLMPLSQNILLLSGRASFELIQKAANAGIPIVAAVGAPSSLAVELAEENNQTLIGFLKNNSFNIYCGHERIC